MVIGNPPYITIGGKQDMNVNFKTKEILLKNYSSYTYKANYFVLFTEFGINLTGIKGIVTYIVPRVLLDNTHMNKIREFILNQTKILTLLELKYKLFENAETGGNLIFIIQREFNNEIRNKNNVNTAMLKGPTHLECLEKITIPQIKYITSENKIFSLNTMEIGTLVEKIQEKSVSLGDICLIRNGVNTGNAAKILLTKENR